jgi:cancer susceptibility candidate protein 1
VRHNRGNMFYDHSPVLSYTGPTPKVSPATWPGRIWPDPQLPCCRAQLSEHYTSCKHACSAHAQEADDALAWKSYAGCSALPDPCSLSCISDYLSTQTGAVLESIPDALSRVRDALTIIDEASAAAARFAQRGRTDEVTRLNRCRLDLYGLITHQIDAATAWFLHHCDLFADSEGNIKHEVTTSRCRWAIWLNINKNPRLKGIEFPTTGLHLEIQKQLALAPIAIRAQIIDCADAYLSECSNEWYAVGDVIKIDLVTLPPMCKATVNEWTLRMHGPLTGRLHQLPYPIPPAGADPGAWQSEEDVPPLGIITDLRPSVVLLADTCLQVRPPELALPAHASRPSEFGESWSVCMENTCHGQGQPACRWACGIRRTSAGAAAR